MNPSNPTSAEMHEIEHIFFEQMRQQTRRATNPILAARIAAEAAVSGRRESDAVARSFDFQFSDRWI